MEKKDVVRVLVFHYYFRRMKLKLFLKEQQKLWKKKEPNKKCLSVILFDKMGLREIS